MKRVAILQSNYIPWKGYFDIIGNVDLFIFHDDLQYTKGDWRNRNKIKTPKGLEWISIPCGTNEKRLICEVELINNEWQKKHWNLIKTYYQKAPYFQNLIQFFEEIYLAQSWKNLSELNQFLIKKIAIELLEINTCFEDSRKFRLKSSKTVRLIELLKKVEATEYLSGPAAKSYLDESEFLKAGISIKWMDYNGYQIYPQLWGEFQHSVSIVDLLFNCGDKSSNYMKFKSNL